MTSVSRPSTSFPFHFHFLVSSSQSARYRVTVCLSVHLPPPPFWHCGPRRTLASVRINCQVYPSLHPQTSILFKSFSASCNHLFIHFSTDIFSFRVILKQLFTALSSETFFPHVLTVLFFLSDSNYKQTLHMHSLQFLLGHVCLLQVTVPALLLRVSDSAHAEDWCDTHLLSSGDKPACSASYHCCLFSVCVKKYQLKPLSVVGHNLFLSPTFRLHYLMLIAFLSCFAPTFSRCSISPLFNLHLETSK
jgi:hypothetical protein